MKKYKIKEKRKQNGSLHPACVFVKAVEQLLLEFMGVCISNIKGWRMKKALFLVGAGDTGKSQLKSLVERLLGKGNFIGIDLKEIIGKRTNYCSQFVS